jgi:hypothetical protein
MPGGTAQGEAVSSFALPFTAQLGSLGSDRYGNAGFTEEAGWSFVSVGQDGQEIFRLSLIRPRQVLLPGGGEGWHLLNNLDRRIGLYDRNGAVVSESGYQGFSAWAGTVSDGGDIYLLDPDRHEVRVYDRSVALLQNIRPETPSGGLFRPNSIAVAPSLNLMVLGDPRRGLIAVYNLFGLLQGTIPVDHGSHRQALTLDYLGRLWVCRPQAGVVSLYGPRPGGWALLHEMAFNSPYAVALSPFGSGVVAEPGSLSFVRF